MKCCMPTYEIVRKYKQLFYGCRVDIIYICLKNCRVYNWMQPGGPHPDSTESTLTWLLWKHWVCLASLQPLLWLSDCIRTNSSYTQHMQSILTTRPVQAYVAEYFKKKENICFHFLYMQSKENLKLLNTCVNTSTLQTYLTLILAARRSYFL